MDFIKLFNSLVCDEILGGAAFQKKKIKHITSKHLGKCLCVGLSASPRLFGGYTNARANTPVKSVLVDELFVSGH